VAALERAQVALAAHDAGGAMRALDRYEVTFPAGRLASEATVLRVQALLARGDAEAASAVADRFFTAHPDSSYARRIRDLLHDAEGNQKKK
jgi:outer membrane protein assembly factor BamD (BamD/ComL family)